MTINESWRFSHSRMLDRSGERTDPTTWVARSPLGMVTTAHYLATAAGADMLARGGNAADAAVAASLALGVCESAGSGLGGMGMVVLHWAARDETIALPGPCRAPRKATPEQVSGSGRYRGHRAVAIPSLPAVLDALHENYCVLNRETLFAPSIGYARNGYPLTPLQHFLVREYRKPLAAGSAGATFLAGDGKPLGSGTPLFQPALATTLERLAVVGFRDFYEGRIARQITGDMEKNSGFISESDLKGFPTPTLVAPLRSRFRGMDVHTLPPPGGGATLVQMLNMYEALDAPDFDPDSPSGALLLAELIRRARRDRVRNRLKIRAEGIGEATELVDPDYARLRVKRILSRLEGNGETSHISVADSDGNLVAMTQSIERSFGAAEMCPDLGFLYNGFLRAFKIRNRRHPHFLSPGAPARSNACPSVLLNARRPWGAIGNTGSERLASGVFQVLVRLKRQTPFEAALAPRLHATPERVVLYEDRLAEGVLDGLSRGFRPERLEPFSFKFGGLNLIVKDGDDYVGVAEPRRDGTAAGPEACG